MSASPTSRTSREAGKLMPRTEAVPTPPASGHRFLRGGSLVAGRNLDFNASAAKGQGAKASFLSLVDRCTMVQLGHRLLGAEVEALSDAHRALVLRHVVLIYGAARTLAGDALKTDWSDWWLLAVGGTRRYLQLSACEVRSHAPGTLVCCYRSYTAPKPQDPKRSRIFRWQVLLVQRLWLQMGSVVSDGSLR
ncbi:unnamed protein product [Effrenium voratum]|nr:unnamed protein product [Effrenium voratum]